MTAQQTTPALFRWKSYTTMLFLASLLIHTSVSIKSTMIPLWLGMGAMSTTGILASALLIVGITNFSRIPVKKSRKILCIFILTIILSANAIYVASCIR